MLPEIFGYDDREDFAYGLILDLTVHPRVSRLAETLAFGSYCNRLRVHSQGQDSNYPRDLKEMR